MRIGMVLDNEFPPDTRVENEALALIKSGFSVYILCYNYGSFDDKSHYKGIWVIRFPFSKQKRNKLHPLVETVPFYKMIWKKQIRKFSTKYKIDVLHVHDLYMAGPALSANRTLKLPLVLDLHENYPAAIKSYNWANSRIGKMVSRQKHWEKLEIKYLKAFNFTILLSEHFKTMLLKKYENLSPKNIIIFQNVPNINQLRSYSINKQILKKKSEFILFYFGAVAERRGIFTCLDSIHILIKMIPNLNILIIGPIDNADEIRFLEYIRKPEIAPHIQYYPWRDISLLPSYIHISDVCLSPILKNEQHESGVANKVFQYMLFERPLLVSNCIPQQQIIESEECGLVFESNNCKDFADKVFTLYQNPELRHKMGKNGKRAVLEKYNWEMTSRHLVDLYRNLGKTQ